MTTIISDRAAGAREEARAANGQFGAQQHTQPEMALTTEATYIDATGPEVPVVSIATGDGYELFTAQEARERLNIRDTEDVATVLAVVDLLAKSSDEDYPPFVTTEPTYADPGNDSSVSAEGWHSPADGVEWEKDVPTWGSDDGRFYMSPVAVLKPAAYGFTAEESEAFEAIVADVANRNSILDLDCTSRGKDGNIRVHMTAGFEPREYVPRIVERRYAEMFSDINPEEYLREVRENGIVLSDTALTESVKVPNGRAIAYAAANGRIPSDAEALAILRDFRVTSTLREGYLHPGEGALGTFTSRTDKADNALAETALTMWFEHRGERA